MLSLLRIEQARRQSTNSTRYQPRGNAARLQTAWDREIILTGPARTGKSRAILEKGYRLSRVYKNLRCLIVRKERSTLAETTLVTLERDVLGFTHPAVIDGPSRQGRMVYRFDNGSGIVIGGMDKPGKILSSEYDVILCPQAEELSEGDFETLVTRLSGKALQQTKQQIIGDCNPMSPNHWIFQRSLSGRLQLWETYHRDNPLLWDGVTNDWTVYGKVYIESLQASLTGTRRKRLLDGLWTQPEGVVYDEFSSENVAAIEPDPEQDIELAIDDGYIDPRAILFIQRTPSRVLVFDEIYHSRHLAETCVSETVDRCQANGWKLPQLAVGSPEAKELQQRLRLANIPYRFQPHKIVQGLDVVRRLVRDAGGQRTLIVHPRCKNLLRELTEGYRYPEQGTKTSDEVPLDENNHAADALRYWAYMRAK